MTIEELFKQGITRMRRQKWACPKDYIRLDVVDGKYGPWFHLYSPINKLLEQVNPQTILGLEDTITDTITDWEPYEGTIDPDDKEESP